VDSPLVELAANRADHSKIERESGRLLMRHSEECIEMFGGDLDLNRLLGVTLGSRVAIARQYHAAV
jgi:hypothetical protein